MKSNRFLSLAAIFALAFTLSCITGCPQVAPKEDRTYSEIVNVPGVSKDDLYEKASLWFSETFKGPELNIGIPIDIPKKSAIISTDKDKGTIKANYTFFTDELDNDAVYQIWLIYSTVDLQVSDGQYRLTFSNPENGAATYTGGKKILENLETQKNKAAAMAGGKWIFSSTEQLFTKYVLATKNTWQSLASNLRETVGGTTADK